MPDSKNNASLLLRLPEDMKAALQKSATLNGRRITAEINRRLRNSLAHEPVTTGTPGDPGARYQRAQEINNADAYRAGLSSSDLAMLEIFRDLPPEKQLALLSLFKPLG